MKAIILAAGEGKRLAPLTLKVPKAMVEYNGKPIIIRTIETLKYFNINQIAAIVGYKKECIENIIKDCFFNPEFASSNMVYSLSFGKDFVYNTNDDFIVSYGDIIYSKEVIEKLIYDENSDISLVTDKSWKKLWKIRMDNIYSDVETFKVKNNKVIELGKKTDREEDIEGQYIGLFKVHKHRVKDFFDIYNKLSLSLDQNRWKNMYMTDYIQYLIDNGWNIKPVWINGNWLEIDTVEDIENYKLANFDIF
ncbi:phosphocholine cytidylyltransferase family protein [Brachyspira pulli]|uniref:phosphocholine cytidylyltransferase family protein n=1 Tax=Brachyspira pulli TaxID=310721 RepID=UPI0030066013